MEQPPSKAAEVFGTVELLESILLALGHRPASWNIYEPSKHLFELQRVSKAFRNTILGSIGLRRNMFLSRHHDDLADYAKAWHQRRDGHERDGATESDPPTMAIHNLVDDLVNPRIIGWYETHRVLQQFWNVRVLPRDFYGGCYDFGPGWIGLQAVSRNCKATGTPLAIIIVFAHDTSVARDAKDIVRDCGSLRQLKILSTRLWLRITMTVKHGSARYAETLDYPEGVATIGDFLDWMGEIVSRSDQEHDRRVLLGPRWRS